MRVVVAMSGGVDSSAAAALLKEQGHEVIGISLRLSRGESARTPGRCCSPEDLDDARAVADHLGIPFYVMETSELFDDKVIRPFVQSYLSGETPIPCTACNREVKFGHLLARARALGGKLATGHYARIVGEPGSLRLLRGRDASRDQSYFLYDLGQEELADLLFPVGELTKAEVREAARRAGLRVADKPESQDICFVPDGDTAGFVERNAGRLGMEISPGPILDGDGEVIGEHEGLHRFTVGQRRGLPALRRRGEDPAFKLPLYVHSLDPDSGAVVVGGREGVERRSFAVADVRWVAGEAPAADEVVTVRVRHGHHGSPCRVRTVGRESVEVEALEAVRAPAPGQSAVFYRGDEVLGGGTITRLRPVQEERAAST